MTQIVLFNKPYGVLSQFTADAGRPTLKDYIPIPNVYAAGRLDADSEGLLILTDDGKMQHRLAHPKFDKRKIYWVQVEGIPGEDALALLRTGIELDGRRTRPASVRLIDAPPDLWPRTPPIRTRARIPTAWIEVGLTEGKNRQIRRMTAKVGFPTLRLIRFSIGEWTLEGLSPGLFKTTII